MALRDHLEPATHSDASLEAAIQGSIAISLKRIADAVCGDQHTQGIATTLHVVAQAIVGATRATEPPEAA